MEIVCSLVYILVFLFVIKKWSFFRCAGIRFQSLSFVFLLKIAFSYLLYFIYENYYGYQGDSYQYFKDAQFIFHEFNQSPKALLSIISSIGYSDIEYEQVLRKTAFWFKEFDHGLYNDNRTLIRLNVIFSLFSFGYYKVHLIFMCFITFLGLTAIYKTFYFYLKEAKNFLFVAVFLVPSVLFWGSGIFKEGVVIMALGILFYALQKHLSYKRTLKNNLLLIAAILILLSIKIYVFLCLIPFIVFFLFFKNSNQHLLIKFAVIHIVCITIAFNLKHIDNGLDIPQYFVMKQGDFLNQSSVENFQHFYNVSKIENNLGSFIMASPKAILATIFKPFIWEANTVFKIMCSIENLIVFILPVLLVFLFRRKKIDGKIWVYGLFSFVVLLFVIIGLTVPVSGAMVRYKTPAIPFMLVLFLLLIDQQKISKTKWGDKINSLLI